MKTRYFSFLFFALICVFNVYCLESTNRQNEPVVSLITSLYKGERFIKNFLENVTNLDMFDQCELIIINANSPENEEPIINSYRENNPNIKYIKLDKDPGLYGVWNMAIKMASGKFITNANVDDTRIKDSLEKQVFHLNNDPGIDLVYSDFYCLRDVDGYSHQPIAPYRHPVSYPGFSVKNMRAPLCGNQPMWRRSMHEKYGFFNEKFKGAGDHEFWLRATSQNSQFLKVPGISGTYYWNPKGLSTTKEAAQSLRMKEENNQVQTMYGYIWNSSPDTPSLLITIPTRSRPEHFLSVLNSYYQKLSGTIPYHFLITCDSEDSTMNNPEVIERMEQYPNLSFYFHDKSKAEAYHAKLLDYMQRYDILVAINDDSMPKIQDYDAHIVQEMKEQFSNFDGILNCPRGFIRKEYNIASIIGKNLFMRSGDLYSQLSQ